MVVKTTYNIGDRITVGGVEHTILSAHLYVTEKKVTERYYLGNQTWVTLNSYTDSQGTKRK